jgi:hypothetical protein
MTGPTNSNVDDGTLRIFFGVLAVTDILFSLKNNISLKKGAINTIHFISLQLKGCFT